VAEVRIAGAAITAFGKIPGRTLRSLAEEAVRDALADAALTPQDVDMVFFGNAAEGLISGQEMVRGQSALRHTGLLGRPIVNVENACASATTAFRMACMAVESGAADVALAVGAEKLTHSDKARPLAAIGTAIDLSEPPTLGGRRTADQTPAGPKSYFMDVYAAMATEYARESGATEADFADVAVKNGRHGALNPKAQYRNGVTREQVLASRVISAPLRLLMCSPVGDGAAAIVVCSEAFARRHGGAEVRVRACVLRSGTDRATGDLPGVTLAAQAAYERAGLGPEDVHVAEVHDGAAPAELIVYEQLGLCGRGEGPKLLASGDTALGGRIPVNTGGGLLSRGHPIGATGCAQLVELVDQLRGRSGGRQVPGARVALAENAGGYLDNDSAAIGVTLLSL
jgi:acetyl-CoA acyltransferase